MNPDIYQPSAQTPDSNSSIPNASYTSLPAGIQVGSLDNFSDTVDARSSSTIAEVSAMPRRQSVITSDLRSKRWWRQNLKRSLIVIGVLLLIGGIIGSLKLTIFRTKPKTTIPTVSTTPNLSDSANGIQQNPGTVTINRDLVVTNATTFEKTITIQGGASIQKDLAVQGNGSIGGNLNIGGNGDVKGNLSVSGDGTYTGTITAANFKGDGSQLTNIVASCTNCVHLQPNSSGSTETGNVSISGVLDADSLQGSGVGITALNASNLTSGIVADARLSTNVALRDANNTFTGITNSFLGNVGIGTGIPGAKLDIIGSSRIQLDNTGIGGGQLLLSSVSNTNEQVYLGYDRTDNVGLIQSIVQGSSVQPFIINPVGGNVGIGTITPAAKLDVAGSILQNGNVVCDASNNCGYAGGGSAAFVQGGNSFGALTVLGTNDNNDLAISTNGTERLRIDTSGNVGVGTASPGQALHVNGDFIFGSASAPSNTFSLGSVVKGLFYNDQDPGGFGYTSLLLGSKEFGSYAGADITYGYGSTANAWTSLFQAGAEINNTADISTRDYNIYDVVTHKNKLGINGNGDIAFGTMNNPNSFADASVIFKSNGYVGIGTTSPTSKLHVLGAAGGSDQLVYSGVDSASFNQPWLGVYLGYSKNTFTALNSSATRQIALQGINEDNTSSGTFGTYGTVLSTNNTGTKPYTIAVQGDAYHIGNGSTNILAGVGGYAVNGGTGTASVMAALYGFSNSNSGVTPLNAGLYLEDQTPAGATNNYQIYSAGANPFVVRSNGNVGIGTASPLAQLNVAGQSLFGSSTLPSGVLTQPAVKGLFYDNTGTNEYAQVNIGAKEGSGYAGGATVYGYGNTSNVWTDLYEFGGQIFNTTDITTRNGFIYDDVSNTYRLAVAGTGDFGVGNLTDPVTMAGASLVVKNSGNVGIGTTNPSNKLSVAGSADFSGHVAVGANSAVDDGSLLYPSSTYSNLLSLEETYTDLTSVTEKSGIVNYLKLDPSTDATTFVYGMDGEVRSQLGNSHNLAGMNGAYLSADHYGSGTADYVSGLEGYSSNDSNGTITRAYGLQATSFNDSSGMIGSAHGGFLGATNLGSGTINTATAAELVVSNYGSGTITDGYGIKINSAVNSGGGTFTNNYGLYVDDQSAVGSSNSYNIYSAGANSKNYFAGKVGIGDANPANKLSVLGNANVDGRLAVGPAALIDNRFTLNVVETVTDPTPLAYHAAVNGQLDIQSSAANSSFVGINGFVQVPSSYAGDVSYLAGGSFGGSHYGGGTIDEMDGAYVPLFNNGGGTVSFMEGVRVDFGLQGSGNVTTARGLDVWPQLYNNGDITNLYGYYGRNALKTVGNTITNNYGLYLEDQTAGTNNYAIYSAGGQSYFAGNVGIGTTNPSNKLSVAGSADFSGHVAIGANSAVNDGSLLYPPSLTFNNLLSLQETYTDLTTPTDIEGIANYLNLNPAANATSYVFGNDNELVVQAGNNKNLPGLSSSYNSVTHEGSGTITTVTGIDVYLGNASTGTITNAQGLLGYNQNYGAGAITNSYGAIFGNYNTGTGTINNGYGVMIQSALNSGGGLFQNNYGLYVQDQSAVGSVNSYNLYSAGANSKNYFAGNVGIGTTNPVNKLHIAADGNARTQTTAYGTGYDSGILTQFARGTQAGAAAVQQDDQIGRLIFQGYDGATFLNAADIQVHVDGTPGTNDMPGRITFHTTPDGSTTIAERMRIDSAGHVGIGTIAPGNLLSIGALTTADASGQLAVSTGGANNKGIIVQAVASQNADLLQAQDSAGAVLASIDKVGNLTVKNATINGTLSVNGHIITANASGTTTITAGAAACTSPTVSVAGNDTSGAITITTGTGCATAGTLGTVSFANAFGTAPRVVLTPTNGNGASLQYYNGASATTTFTLDTNTTPTDATTYSYNYQVLQ